MATIKKFRGKNSKEQNTEREMSYSRKLHLHRLKVFVAVLVAVAIFGALITAAVIYEATHSYSELSVVGSIEKIYLDTTSYMNNGDTLIAYSKDGMSCISNKGETVWNMTYDMQEPIIRRSEAYVGACDYNGHEIRIADSNGNISIIDTKLPIRDFAICKEGRIAAIIDDSTNSWINLYDVNGTKYSEIKATMSQTGYPLSLAVSDEVLAVSYLYVDSESMKSRVTFYNFGGVGENVPDKIVSNYGYDEVVVPTIEYLDKENIYALADDRILFYSGAKQPKSVKDVLLNEKIVGVYKGYSTVGLVFYDISGEKKYRIDVYNKSGDLEFSYRFNMDFKDVVIRDEIILIYNESECVVVNNDGKEKYEGLFEEPVKYIGTTNSAKKFFFVKENTIETVRFE